MVAFIDQIYMFGEFYDTTNQWVFTKMILSYIWGKFITLNFFPL